MEDPCQDRELLGPRLILYDLQGTRVKQQAELTRICWWKNLLVFIEMSVAFRGILGKPVLRGLCSQPWNAGCSQQLAGAQALSTLVKFPTDSNNT